MSKGKLHLLPMGPTEETLLVEQLKQGAPEAFEMVYQRFVGRVLGVARQILHDQASAQDVAQEAFLKIFTDIHRFRGDGRLVSWIHRITVNLAISELRRRKTARRARASFPPKSLQATSLGQPELTENLKSILGKLEPRKRLTFYLYHVEGLSGAEMADVLGESRDAVLKRLQRTREELLLLWDEPEQEVSRQDEAGGGAK